MVFGFGKPNIENLEKKKDVKGLIKALNSKNDNVIRLDAVKALGSIGDARAVKPLINLLYNDDKGDQMAMLNNDPDGIKHTAIESLISIGDPAVEPLINILHDTDGNVRVYGASALGSIGDARAVEPLINLLLNDNDWMVRKDAGYALGSIGDARAIEPLTKALHDKDDPVIGAAIRILGSFGESAVEPLTNALQDDYNYSYEVAEALGNIGDARAIEPLTNALQFKDELTQKYAAEALKKINAKQ